MAQYLPLSQASTAEPSPNVLDRALKALGFAPESDEPPEWRADVSDAPVYMASCFAYCAAGGLLLLHPEPLERHMAFPWRLMGLMVFANGFFSYMADVETWGRTSRWKAADRLLATTNTLLQIAIVASACMGHASFPVESVALLFTGVATGLVCKHRASASMRRGDCESFLRWHAAWHYTLPLGAILGQLVLHRKCDYSFATSCACASART